MSKKEAILIRSTDIFFQSGFHKLSMDELASRIGISKKTIYNNYKSKEKLLEAIIFTFMKEHVDEITGILLNQEINIIEKISLAFNKFYPFYASFEQPLSKDPNAVRIFHSPQCLAWDDQIKKAIYDLAVEAGKEGLIKPGIQIEMFPYILIKIINTISTWERPDDVSFSKTDFLKETMKIVLGGILTGEAMKDLSEFNGNFYL